LPGGLDPQFGTTADRGFPGIFKSSAITLEDDRISDGASLEPAEIAGNAEAAHVSLADGGIPARLDFASAFIGCDPIVEDDIGAGRSADRAVQVAECRAPIGGAASIIGCPAT